MYYKTEEWKLKAFQFDPNDSLPEWFAELIPLGKAQQFAETDRQKAHLSFSDKRSDHKAFIGDWITLDQFGRLDVYSNKNFKERCELL